MTGAEGMIEGTWMKENAVFIHIHLCSSVCLEKSILQKSQKYLKVEPGVWALGKAPGSFKSCELNE